jgi:putative endonuclease
LSRRRTLLKTSDGDARKALGNRAEECTATWLSKQGYKVVERNYRCKVGEVDIVARKDEYLCFVEVRSRSTDAMGSPSLTVDARKQRQVIRAAMTFLAVHKISNMNVRFDVAAVTFGPSGPAIEYIPGAFEAGF